MLNVTLEYTTTHFNVLGQTQPGNPSPTSHTHQRTLNSIMHAVMVVFSRKLSRKNRTNRVLNTGHVVCESITLSACRQLLLNNCTYSACLVLIFRLIARHSCRSNRQILAVPSLLPLTNLSSLLAYWMLSTRSYTIIKQSIIHE